MSGFYIGVDGKARKVKGGYIGVDGKARKIKKGYIGDANGVARLCWSGIDSVFANNSWEEIIAVCQTGQVPETWAVGDQKAMTIGGTEYLVDIIGKNHDDYYDGSGKAPLTLQIHDLFGGSGDVAASYPAHVGSTNSVGWNRSQVRVSYLPEILNLMPTVISSNIREVRKRTSSGSWDSSISETADKLFTLSEFEIFGDYTNSFSGEGTQYEYFKLYSRRIKRLNGTAKAWWLRSPYNDSSTQYCYVTENGETAYRNATIPQNHSFAFCF